MKEFKIYAGMVGGFGGAVYLYTTNCNNKDEATDVAYQEACEIYEMQEGSGCDGWDDFMEEARNSIPQEDLDDADYQDALTDYASQLSNDAMHSWIDYYAVEKGSEDDDDQEDDDYDDDIEEDDIIDDDDLEE
jgi:hypothetical protein